MQSETTTQQQGDAPSAVEHLGILERLGNGAGFIRRRHAGYLPSDDDIYVGQKLVDRFDLRTGDEIAGDVGKPPGQESAAQAAPSTAPARRSSTDDPTSTD